MKYRVLSAVKGRFLIVMIVGMVILLAGGLLAVSMLRDGRLNSRTDTSAASQHNPDAESLNGMSVQVPDIPIPSPTPLAPWQGAGRLNILLMAVDLRSNEDSDQANTDTLILFTLDPATHSAGMLSIPRDLYVSLTNHGEGRINTALRLGGPDYAMQEVGRVVGVSVQHYVRVDFDTLSSLVDLIGGVDVDVDQDINDPKYPTMNYGYEPFVLSKGMHHLDGATALKYARTRHGSSDIVRMHRQQQIIMAVRDQVLKPEVLAKLTLNAPQVINILSQSIESDLSLNEMVQLALFAKDLPADRVTRVVMDETVVQGYTTPSGAQVLLLIPGRIQKLTAKWQEPPGAGAAAPVTPTLTMP